MKRARPVYESTKRQCGALTDGVKSEACLREHEERRQRGALTDGVKRVRPVYESTERGDSVERLLTV